jgi:hypothetical protein
MSCPLSYDSIVDWIYMKYIKYVYEKLDNKNPSDPDWWRDTFVFEAANNWHKGFNPAIVLDYNVSQINLKTACRMMTTINEYMDNIGVEVGDIYSTDKCCERFVNTFVYCYLSMMSPDKFVSAINREGSCDKCKIRDAGAWSQGDDNGRDWNFCDICMFEYDKLIDEDKTTFEKWTAGL